MQKEKDIVMVPLMWLPPKVLQLIGPKNVKPGIAASHTFYTDELGGESNVYYIDGMGRLILKDVSMSVVVDERKTGTKEPALVFDISHKALINPDLNIIYCKVKNKMCTLELYFDDGMLYKVNPIIEP